MSMPYPQQPVGQPAAPYVPGQPAVPYVPGQPVVPYVPGQPVYQGVPQGYSTAPQGFAPGYAPVPQGPVTRKVNWVSIILGVVGWTLIGLTVLAMWMALSSAASDVYKRQEIIGFFPLFAMIFIGPVNLAGGIIGIVGATGAPKVRKLNWLGILLNASPYIVFTVLMIVLMFVK